jgi:hypothetical protein
VSRLGAERVEKNSTVAGAPATSTERHYSVAEVAVLWNLSQDTVRRLFLNEPGVLILGDLNPRRSRRYVTLRIPEHVLERVHRHYSNAPKNQK